MESRFEISIALVGCVSTGKSTILNALFLDQFSDMKIKRTTMLPQVYHEVSSKREILTGKEINKQTRATNTDIIKKTETGNIITLEECKQMDFYVHKINYINVLHKGVHFAIYDIPGLNDARTKNVYFNWLNINFRFFDIVLFVVDIMSGLNTSDEVEILMQLLKNMKEIEDKHNKYIQLIVVINKCDDLDIDNDKINICDDEQQEMFDQIKSTVEEKIKTVQINRVLYFTPLCARDAYLFRILKKNPEYELTPDQKNHILLNVYGKLICKTKSKKDKDKMITEFIENTEKIDAIIKSTGFDQLIEVIRMIFPIDKQYDALLSNIMYDVRQIKQFDLSNTEECYRAYLKQYDNTVMLDQLFKKIGGCVAISTIFGNRIKKFDEYIKGTFTPLKI